MIVGYTYGFMCSSQKADKIREGKLKVLKDMGIALTESEMEIFNKLATQRQIDDFMANIFRTRL